MEEGRYSFLFVVQFYNPSVSMLTLDSASETIMIVENNVVCKLSIHESRGSKIDWPVN